MEEIPKTLESKKQFIAHYEKYMFVVGILGHLLFYLQGIKIFLNHSAENLSLPAFLFSLASLVSWLVYGFIIKNYVLIVTNLFAIVGAVLVITGILFHT